jgi:quinoprotein glucose dehydrogenase
MAVSTDPMMGLCRSLRIAVLALLAALCGTVRTAHSQTHSASAHRSKSPSNVDWPVYGGQAAGDHYSSLSQINRKNVHKLQLAWKFDADEEGGLETSPIIVGRILYGYTASQKVIALDAASGKLIWKFESGIKGKNPIRGVSYWTDGKEGCIFAPVTNFCMRWTPERANQCRTSEKTAGTICEKTCAAIIRRSPSQ